MATAIITGASQGIGACIAVRLAKDGYNIAINHFPSDSDLANAENVAQQCRDLGVEAELFPANVADYAQCENMTKAVKERFGTIDALVNNAGITKDGLMVRMPEEQYDAVIAVNQKSVFHMLKLVGAVMMRQRHGRIVSLASVAGLYGNPGQINYAASKAAIIGMTKTAAKELGARNVTVNAVAPGFIKTPMTDALTEEQRSHMLELVAMKRYAQPEEVASVVSFLCSDDASYVTGQTIEISGGLMI
ncbi:MAG: 3-oxoacyl-[acyl-carrier-protein] reductase [Ruminococcus sp.]|nr:3-oxoacyl-[acyl-carrier-protein] reductase [Ruminococcus sp.]